MLPSQAQWQAALEARHGRALQEKFSAATVALCGLGGLGSHIAGPGRGGKADPAGL